MEMAKDGLTDNIEEAILPVEVEEPAVPIPLDTLKPWHSPRKQYIRENQWRRCAELLIRRLQGLDAPSVRTGTLNYLTLPGIDHFDVQILGELAKEFGFKLEATGFLSEAAKDRFKARSQFRADTLIKRGLIEDTSITFPYQFEEISSPKSQAYRQIKTRAPFHIINIDACGSIAAPSSQHSGRIINAMHRLVELQIGRTREPWLLYLTTDIRETSLSEEVKDALENAIRENATSSDEFCKETIAFFGMSHEDIEMALAGASSDPKKFISKFSLGFAKWLLHNADSQNWNLKCHPFFCYSTTPKGDDRVSMPCLAFEFRPRPIVLEDRFGVVEAHNPIPSESHDYSMEALRRTQSMQNVDSLLENDKNLRIEFAQKQRELLQNAGYLSAALSSYDEQYSV